MTPPDRLWPDTENDLVAAQMEIGLEAPTALGSHAWMPGPDPVLGGCFFAASGDGAPGGEQAWAAAVTWRPSASPYRRGAQRYRRGDDALKGSLGVPRRASDVEAQVVICGRAPAPYRPGLLALRQGRMLARAVALLEVRPDVVLVDGTGLDHPRHAGLALHMGAAVDLPTVGVTDRALLATGDPPMPVRGARSPLTLDGEVVGYRVTTRTGARPVLAHAAWRTSPETAARVVLLATTGAARTPVPLQEARRAAREARSHRIESTERTSTGDPGR